MLKIKFTKILLQFLLWLKMNSLKCFETEDNQLCTILVCVKKTWIYGKGISVQSWKAFVKKFKELEEKKDSSHNCSVLSPFCSTHSSSQNFVGVFFHLVSMNPLPPPNFHPLLKSGRGNNACKIRATLKAK